MTFKFVKTANEVVGGNTLITVEVKSYETDWSPYTGTKNVTSVDAVNKKIYLGYSKKVGSPTGSVVWRTGIKEKSKLEKWTLIYPEGADPKEETVDIRSTDTGGPSGTTTPGSILDQLKELLGLKKRQKFAGAEVLSLDR